MKKYRLFFPWIFMLFWILSCGKQESIKSTTKSSTPMPVSTTTVEQQSGELQVSATVVPRNRAVLSSRFPAFVLDVAVMAGQRVGKGDLLLQLDDRNLRAQQKKLQSVGQEMELALQEARNHLEAASAQQKLAASTWEKIKALYEKKAASKQ